MRTKQRNNLAETARHERVAQNTDVYAVKARNYKGLRRGSPVFKINHKVIFDYLFKSSYMPV